MYEDEPKRTRAFDHMLVSQPVTQSLLNETETASETARRIWSNRPEREQVDPPTPAPLELQQQVFTDLACQLVTNLTLAAKDDCDLRRSARILAECDCLCEVFARVGFNLLGEFQHELRTDLGAALCKARSLAVSS
jgi:hypothetical protein